MTTTQKQELLIAAFNSGSPIEFHSIYDSEDNWYYTDNPVWDWENFTYRVASQRYTFEISKS